MNWNDDLPQKKRTEWTIGADLSALSLAELDAYLAVLAAERARVEAAQTAKRASQQAAQSAFKS